MKRLAIAGLLAAALSLTCLSQQKAAAWGCGCGSGEFNFSIGFSISGSWSCNSCCSPCCGGCGYSLCPDVSAYAGCGNGGCGYGYGGYCDASYAAPQAIPAAPAAAPVATTGVQTAGYFYPAASSYPAGYGYGYSYYGYGQAPSYWYGR